jgi:hypothetical protein
MTNLRHPAYKLDPALWVLDVVGQTPAALATDLSARTARRVDSRLDRTPGRQDHDGGLGDRA